MPPPMDAAATSHQTTPALPGVCSTHTVGPRRLIPSLPADGTQGHRDLAGGKDLERFYRASAANSTVPTRFRGLHMRFEILIMDDSVVVRDMLVTDFGCSRSRRAPRWHVERII